MIIRFGGGHGGRAPMLGLASLQRHGGTRAPASPCEDAAGRQPAPALAKSQPHWTLIRDSASRCCGLRSPSAVFCYSRPSWLRHFPSRGLDDRHRPVFKSAVERAGHCFIAVTVLFSSRICIYIFFKIISASLLIVSI